MACSSTASPSRWESVDVFRKPAYVLPKKGIKIGSFFLTFSGKVQVIPLMSIL